MPSSSQSAMPLQGESSFSNYDRVDQHSTVCPFFLQMQLGNTIQIQQIQLGNTFIKIDTNTKQRQFKITSANALHGSSIVT